MNRFCWKPTCFPIKILWTFKELVFNILFNYFCNYSIEWNWCAAVYINWNSFLCKGVTVESLTVLTSFLACSITFTICTTSVIKISIILFTFSYWHQMSDFEIGANFESPFSRWWRSWRQKMLHWRRRPNRLKSIYRRSRLKVFSQWVVVHKSNSP